MTKAKLMAFFGGCLVFFLFWGPAVFGHSHAWFWLGLAGASAAGGILVDKFWPDDEGQVKRIQR
jgi:hypothetical protein